MKKIIITSLLALVAMVGQGQDVNTCQPIAERILTDAQNHSYDGIDELLAPEFHFSDIKQPIAEISSVVTISISFPSASNFDIHVNVTKS